MRRKKKCRKEQLACEKILSMLLDEIYEQDLYETDLVRRFEMDPDQLQKLMAGDLEDFSMFDLMLYMNSVNADIYLTIIPTLTDSFGMIRVGRLPLDSSADDLYITDQSEEVQFLENQIDS